MIREDRRIYLFCKLTSLFNPFPLGKIYVFSSVLQAFTSNTEGKWRDSQVFLAKVRAKTKEKAT
ncbi:hypothetical protein Mcup_0468 [Metallosphaera cuprina Ar-4]|uniref:Uncharacterized protein n=1 Tax=Metallosphaera cuprina (strain Ar-4) TaxID=1006006 RepID=F4G076_METCR|nr:hypothetical protein Mcup_0468 [Metallosphaera cuprina Ar-4]